MVLKCLHFNYNETSNCNDYKSCARNTTCPQGNHNCFSVWAFNNTYQPLSAGCHTDIEACHEQCEQEMRGPRYYCCCTTDFCNSNLIPRAFNLTSSTTTPDPPTRPPLSSPDYIFWALVSIGLISLFLASVFVYRFKRSRNHDRSTVHLNGQNVDGFVIGSAGDPARDTTLITGLLGYNSENNEQQIRRTKGMNGGANARELTDMRVNNANVNRPDVSLLVQAKDQSANAQVQGHKGAFDLNNLILSEVIGSGRCAEVRKALLGDNLEVAVKIIEPKNHISWLNEKQIYSMPNLKHLNILDFYHADEHLESDRYWLVFEYAPRGSLNDFLKDNTVTWEEVVHMSMGIVSGLSHLHDNDIVHRDFKSKNILLRHDLTPCVSDFNVASVLDLTQGTQSEDKRLYQQVGTPRYMAPEVLEGQVVFNKSSYTKADVYALSLVLWELLTRTAPNAEPYQLPFEDVAGLKPDIDTMRRVVVMEKKRPVIKPEWQVSYTSEFCRAIVDGWEYDHDARISASCFVERVKMLSNQSAAQTHLDKPE